MAFEKKFKKKCVILFRAHPNDKSNSDRMIDVSDYDDMQELLCISDALITDYSSSIWDFSFTYVHAFCSQLMQNGTLQIEDFACQLILGGFLLQKAI